MCNGVKHDKLHGRVTDTGRLCSAPGCDAPGEFRAPGVRPSGFDGPGDYRWFCLDHIRAFNAGYDFFDGYALASIAVSFRVTQSVDRTLGVHGMIPKKLFIRDANTYWYRPQ